MWKAGVFLDKSRFQNAQLEYKYIIVSPNSGPKDAALVLPDQILWEHIPFNRQISLDRGQVLETLDFFNEMDTRKVREFLGVPHSIAAK